MKKKTTGSLLLTATAIFMISCKPTLKISADYDRSVNFSAYKTFGMFSLASNKNVNQLNEDRIWNSIRIEMIKKGYAESNNNPDLLVNAVTVVKNKNYLSATTGYGYGVFYRPYGYWGAPGHTTVQSYEYKSGSLVIDVVDAKTNKLVWEGTGNAEFENKPKNPEKAIRAAVNKILGAFPAGDIKNGSAGIKTNN